MKQHLLCAAILGAGLGFGMAEAATPPDTIVMAKQIDDVISLDPAESFEFSGNEAVTQMYERLIGYDLKDVSKLYGKLAESWSVAPDGKTYTFKIRQGVKFHSGNVMTAADAAWSLQRAVILKKTPNFILTQFGFDKDNVKDRIRATDAATLVIETKDPVAPTFFYYCLTAVVASVVDSKAAMANEKDGDMGNAWLKNAASAGTGPYRLVSWRANEAYTQQRHDDYWGSGKATTRRVVVRHVAEPATQRLLLEKGDVDYARNLGKDQLDALAGNADIKVQEALKGSIFYFALNQKNPILAKPEVREAIKWLVDYDAIEKNILRGSYAVHQAFLPSGFLGAVTDKPYKFDLDKAKALLAQAGHPNGFTVTMDVRSASPYSDVAQAVQASLARAGIKLDLIPGDGRQTLTKYRARNHDIYIGLWGPDYQDPHTNAETFAMNPDNAEDARAKTLAWRNAWDIPQMTQQIAAAVKETDPEKRKAIYEAAQREHQKASPFVIMFQQIEVAARRSNVDGLIMGPSFDDNLYYAVKKN